MIKLFKKGNILIAVAVMLAVSLAAFAMNFTVAKADNVDEIPAADVVLDMDGTQSWLEVDGAKVAQLHKDNVLANGFFPGAKGESMMMFTEQIANEGLVAVKLANKYKAENFSSVIIRLVVGNGLDSNTNVITLNGYGLSDAKCATSSGNVVIEKGGNVNVDLKLSAAVLADADGYISGFVMKKTETMTEQTGQIFADYVKLVLAEEKAPTENVIVDLNDVDSWLEIDGSKTSVKLHQGAAGDNDIPGLFPGADNSTKMCFTENLGNEEYFTIKFAKKIKAEYFEKIKVELVIGNWAETGNAITTTAYALSDTKFTKPAGKVKTLKGNIYKVLAIDPALVANEDGYIEGFVIRKTETDTAAKGQYFVNGVEFCLVGSEPKPVVSEEYIEKDISEVMPVGSGVTFNVKTDAENLNKTTVQSAVKTAAFDKLNFKITPNANGKFSTYVLMKAPTATSTYEDGGIFFWISNDNVVIGNEENSESAVAAEFPENAFVSGQTTTVSIAAIPYYLDGTHAGYYCALYVGDNTEALVEIYLDITTCETGVYTNILTQDLGNDYDVAYASASETPKSAAEVMNVKLATTSGKTEFKTPRAGLTLSHFEVAGEIVGDLVIEGDATYDKDTKFLTFTKEGTVKVYYTVKNAFGEFKSNELSLTYVTEKPSDSGHSQSGSSKGCGGSVASVSALSVLAAAAVIVIAKKKKND